MAKKQMNAGLRAYLDAKKKQGAKVSKTSVKSSNAPTSLKNNPKMLGRGGRIAQMQAMGIPDNIVGPIARKAGAVPMMKKKITSKKRA
jgi:hypothetical protein